MVVDLLRRRENASLQTGEWRYLDCIVGRLVTELKAERSRRDTCLRRKQVRQRKKLERKRKKRSKKQR